MPSRLLFDLGDVVPAGGTLRLAGGAGRQQAATSWSTVSLAASLSAGSGVWTVQVVRGEGQPGTLLGTGQGSGLQAGPFHLAPGEMIQIQVTGATVGASVTGSAYGIQGLRPDQLDVLPATPIVTTNVNATIAGPVGVTDAGLAGSVAAALSQLQHVTDVSLTFGATVSFQFGAGQATAYPPGTASWQVIVRGIAGSSAKMVVTYFDPAGNVLYATERHSNLILSGGQLVATGPAHGNSMKFDITLSAGSGSPIASIYTAGVILGDRWFDSGIYQGLGVAASAGVIGGRDGVLWEVNNNIFSSGNTAVNLPTYRGPIQITANTTNAPYQFNFIDYDYLHNILDTSQQLYFQPSGGASTTLPTTIAFLAGLRYDLVFGNQTGANLTASFSVRAIDDLQ